MARRIEKISTVSGIDVKKYARDYNRLFFEQLFKECLQGM